MVSAYFHFVRSNGEVSEQLKAFLPKPYTVENISENLPEFIRFMQTNRNSTVDYLTHITNWYNNRATYVLVRYEDMLCDAAGEVCRIVSDITGHPPDAELVESVVKKHDFAKVTKRKHGEEDSSAFVRKGISGDWKNYFSRDAAQVYDKYAGALLHKCGYEDDPDWYKNI
jgi:hypothetical protein